jgi:hypothetical protein
MYARTLRELPQLDPTPQFIPPEGETRFDVLERAEQTGMFTGIY